MLMLGVGDIKDNFAPTLYFSKVKTEVLQKSGNVPRGMQTICGRGKLPLYNNALATVPHLMSKPWEILGSEVRRGLRH